MHPDRHRIESWRSPVLLRLAEPRDAAALERIARLDSRPLPPGPHLVAERRGEIVAALSLADHEVVADPFQRTAELAQLLRCHAGPARIQPAAEAVARLRPRPAVAPA
jgi:hypothetical protein